VRVRVSIIISVRVRVSRVRIDGLRICMHMASPLYSIVNVYLLCSNENVKEITR